MPRATPSGGCAILATGCHCFCLASWLANQLKPLAVIAGLGHELELAEPVRCGDRLSMRSECVEKRGSRSKHDRGIVTSQAEMMNQSGVVVFRMRSILMLAQPAGAHDNRGGLS